MRRCLMHLLMIATIGLAADTPPKEPLLAGRPFSAWMVDLKSPNALIREEALLVLKEAGANAKEAFPQVRPLLKDPQPIIRVRAALLLTSDAKPTEEILEALREGINVPGLPLRYQILDLITERATLLEGLIPDLVKLLDQSDGITRGKARDVLQRMGTVVLPALLPLLENPTATRLTELVPILISTGAGQKPEIPDKLLELFRSKDPAVRLAAVQCRNAIKPEPAVCFPILEELIVNQPNQKVPALELFLGLEPKPKSAIPILEETLKSTNVLNQIRAADGLYKLERRTKDTIPPLFAAIRGTPAFSTQAVMVLGQMDAAAEEVVTGLLEMIRKNEFPNYTLAFGRLVPLGEKAIAPLLAGVTEPDTRIRQLARSNLALMGEKAITGMVEKLPKADPTIKAELLLALAVLPTPPEGLVAVAVAALDDKNPELQGAAISVLSNGGPEARKALPRLRELVTDEVGVAIDLRRVIVVALTGAELADPENITTLLKLIQNPKTPEPLRQWVILHLGGCWPAAKTAIPELVRRLHAEPQNDWVIAAQALGHFPDSPEALAGLVNWLKEKKGTNPAQDLAVMEALGKFGDKARDAFPLLESRITNGATQFQALRTAIQIGGPTKEAIPRLKAIIPGAALIPRGLLFVLLLQSDAFEKEHLPLLWGVINYVPPTEIAVFMELLAKQEKLAPEIDAELWKFIQNPNQGSDFFKFRAAETVLKLKGPHREDALKWLNQMASIPDPNRSAEAVVLLDRFAPNDAVLVPIMLRNLSSIGVPPKVTILKHLLIRKELPPSMLAQLNAYIISDGFAEGVLSALVVYRHLPEKRKATLDDLVRQSRKIIPVSPTPLVTITAVPPRLSYLAMLPELGNDAKQMLPTLKAIHTAGPLLVRQEIVKLVRVIDPESLK